MLYMARGSAYETEHWLERAAVRGLVVPNDAVAHADRLRPVLNELIAKPRTQGLRTEN